MSGPITYASSAAAFRAGVKAAVTSVFFPVISGTYVGVGALAHGFGFAPGWLGLSTLLVWAAPAQVIMISALGSGSPLIEAAIAVSLSGVRLLPMVVALLPLLRSKGVRLRDLIMPAHFTAVSMWVESLRLLPMIAQEWRVAYCNGVAVGFMSAAIGSGFIGYYLAAELPVLLAGALLFLTPLAFLMSTARNARQMMDKLALALGLVIGPALAYYHVGLDLMWTGVIGGALAYGVHRLRGAAT